MRIVNNKRFYQRDINSAVRIDGNGWDRYNGSDWQWYHLLYNPACGLVILDANNSGSCYGDYSTLYFDSPASFVSSCHRAGDSWAQLLGDIDESNDAAMQFVAAILGDEPEQQREEMTGEQIRRLADWASSKS